MKLPTLFCVPKLFLVCNCARKESRIMNKVLQRFLVLLCHAFIFQSWEAGVQSSENCRCSCKKERALCKSASESHPCETRVPWLCEGAI